MAKCKEKGCHIGRCCCLLLTVFVLSMTAAAGFFAYAFLFGDANSVTYMRTPIVTFLFPITSEDESQLENVSLNDEVNFRLPTSLKPIHYIIKLQPLINSNRSIFGSVEIEFEVVEAAANVTLHINNIITKNETVKVVPSDDPSGPGVGIIQQTYDNVRQFYVAELETELEQGKMYIISMNFEGYLNDDLRGFYRSTYFDADGEAVYMAVTQFQPTDARQAFPCFDEPAMKATFEVYLAREDHMSSISNMPLYETLPVEGQEGWFWDHFNTSVPMSTYLVAFVVSDFTYVNSTFHEHVLFRVWSRKNAINQSDYAIEKGPEVLSYYEEYFGIPFPLPKQDMIAITDFAAGAMENWGLITYRETAILFDPIIGSARNKQRVMEVIAHELAHQWFGDLVTPEWWGDIWLNEGFANFMENYGSNHCEPSWKIMEQLIVDDIQTVFRLDALESSHPISVPVGDPAEIGRLFDSISYDKGTSIIRMMNTFLMENTFKKGISAYLNAFQYANAEQDDLWQYLTEAGHEDETLPSDLTVKEVMDTWTLQMGYPVINVIRSSDGSSATVSQNRFLLVENENSTDPHNYMWWVPLSYTSQDSPDFESTQVKVWMKDSETEITVDSLPSEDKWVIFNIQETGYYRVNYDENNWNLLIQQLQTDHEGIHVINRAQIIDDALNLARAGQLSYTTALSVDSYLAKEVEYIPWTAALDNMAYLESMFTRTGGYGNLKNYLLDLLIPLYDSVGFDDDLNDPHLEQLQRVEAVTWACNMGHGDCLTNSVSLYADWMLNPTDLSIISPNLKGSVYCTAIADGREEEWNFAWNQLLTSNIATENNLLLSALGCSKEVWILAKYLELTFSEDSPIRKQDASRVFSAVARNDAGRDLAWDYLRNEFDMLSSFFTSFTHLGDMLLVVTSEFNTEEEKKELLAFRDEHLGEIGLAIDQAIETTSNNIDWMNNNYDVILQWLIDHGYSK